MLPNPVSLFKDKAEIESILQRVEGKQKTEDLVKKLAHLKQIREPFYLTSGELNEIFHWKLRNQYGRQLKRREINNTDANIQIITKAAFAIKHNDNEEETALKIKILSTLSGVSTPVASAILTLCYPDSYAVIDFRNWRQVYSVKKSAYNANEYSEYLSVIKKWAKEFDMTTQEMDVAIWQLDNEKYPKKGKPAGRVQHFV